MLTNNPDPSKNQFAVYPPILPAPFMGPDPPPKLNGSVGQDGISRYFQNYRNEVLSKFAMPEYQWSFERVPYSLKSHSSGVKKIRDLNRLLTVPSSNISTIDLGRIREVDDFFKLAQIHRNQYKDRTGQYHPLAFFKSSDYHYQCAPSLTTSYFSKHPRNFVDYKLPIVLPISYGRRIQTPYIPELSLSGVYTRSGCIAYKR